MRLEEFLARYGPHNREANWPASNPLEAGRVHDVDEVYFTVRSLTLPV